MRLASRSEPLTSWALSKNHVHHNQNLKKIAPIGGRRETFWSISCEKLRFYTKKSYFFQLRREARKFLGYFVWKITILRHKIIFFLILGGGGEGARGVHPLWIRPCNPLSRKSWISYQLRDIYSIYRYCWNVATSEWKVHNGKIEIISIFVKFHS